MSNRLLSPLQPSCKLVRLIVKLLALVKSVVPRPAEERLPCFFSRHLPLDRIISGFRRGAAGLQIRRRVVGG